jgi:glycosyltransferase involved in cell wall biosynthesis
MRFDKVPKLSICIATFNRGAFIAETLNSILSQNSEQIEIVVVDGGSKDNTQKVLEFYQNSFSNFNYYREEVNSGVDIDYDKAIQYANGYYCWLMTDDDLLIDGAIERLLCKLIDNYDLLVLNSEVWNTDFTFNLETRMSTMIQDKIYTGRNKLEMFADLGTCLSFIGSVVIRRRVWLERVREKYYGSLFVHVGVIFQSPIENDVYFHAEPIIKIRYGNGMWSPRSFEIWYFKWPELVWSFGSFEDLSKSKIVMREPWRRYWLLIKSRAIGEYTWKEYETHFSKLSWSISRLLTYSICFINPKLLNFILVILYVCFKPRLKYTIFDLIRSRNSSRFSRRFVIFFNPNMLPK